MAWNRRIGRTTLALLSLGSGCGADVECAAAGCFDTDLADAAAGLNLLQMQTARVPVEHTALDAVPASASDAVAAAAIHALKSASVGDTVVLNASASQEKLIAAALTTSVRRRYRRGQAFKETHVAAVALVLSLFAVQLMWVQYCSKKKMENILAEKQKARSATASQPLPAACADVLGTEKAMVMGEEDLRSVFKNAPCCCLQEWRKYRSQWRMAGQKEEARLHSRVMLLLHGEDWGTQVESCSDERCLCSSSVKKAPIGDSDDRFEQNGDEIWKEVS